jgi:plastocyanin
MQRATSLAWLVAISVASIGHTWADEERAAAQVWVRGRITVEGPVPKSSVPDDAGVQREILEIDAATGGLPSVLVTLTPLDGTTKLTGAQSKTWEGGRTAVVVDQQDYAFVPRVVAVQAGQPVRFTNSDAANHNVRTTSLNSTNEFNVYTGIGGQYQHQFAHQTNQRPIALGCDIHPWMRGWIYVLDHPLFAVTDKAGLFQIGPMPSGEYMLGVRQPDLRYAVEQKLSVAQGQPPLQWTIRAEKAARGATTER